jgi:hypothetical protein
MKKEERKGYYNPKKSFKNETRMETDMAWKCLFGMWLAFLHLEEAQDGHSKHDPKCSKWISKL